jgi:hypothetical protein
MVNGVARIKPIGPQSQVQKVADAITATGDRPALRPYTRGSITWPAIGSTTKKSAAVERTIDHPVPTAAASISGNIAEITAPIYGTKRSIIANMPHNGALGTPMNHNPIPIMRPKPAFNPN